MAKKSPKSVTEKIVSKDDQDATDKVRSYPWRIGSVACGLGILLLALIVHWYQDQLENPLQPRYNTSFDRTKRQSFLERSPDKGFSCAFEMKIASNLESVVPVMNHNDRRLAQNQLFIMLNGENHGVRVTLAHDNRDHEDAVYCLYELMLEAGQFLGLSKPRLEQGMTLMTFMGQAIHNPASILGSGVHEDVRRVHLLLRYQLWVWPGIDIGYEYHLDDNENDDSLEKSRRIILTTRSLEPKVLSVSGFFTSDEALAIITQGHAEGFDRSPVATNLNVENPVHDMDDMDDISSDRTSDTAFLSDSVLTREMSRRGAQVARLPSASFVSNLQVVRYASGQYFREHTDYFDHLERDLRSLDKSAGWIQYQVWLKWLQEQLDDMTRWNQDISLPSVYVGGTKYPHIVDEEEEEEDPHQLAFEHALLETFLSSKGQSYFGQDEMLKEWQNWIEENLKLEHSGTLEALLDDQYDVLLPIIRAYEEEFHHATSLPLEYHGWIEDELVVQSLRTNGVSKLFYWIRAAKVYLEHDLEPQDAHAQMMPKPGSEDYPSYARAFLIQLTKLLLEDRDELQTWLDDEWIDWVVTTQDHDNTLLALLQDFPHAFERIIQPWYRRYFSNARIPAVLESLEVMTHFEPNRFVTLFLYLNDVPGGGETVFPLSKERWTNETIERTGMEECSDGLAVPPTRLTASLFYSQRPSQIVDPSSLHGGCPPTEGTKFGANLFAWNTHAEEGADLWT